jgi:hypothetical protein
MAQIFHPSFNTLSRVSIFGAVFFLAALAWLAYDINRSPYVTQADVVHAQPVEFSHAHHVGGLGIHCVYCHTSVEESYFAGIPPTRTCMNCHSQIWSDSPQLEPVRASFQTGQPIPWVRVHDLPDFSYFDHSIHVAKGIGCATCHGPVDRMPMMRREHSLSMQWCLECHHQPEKYIRPREEVFNMNWAREGFTDGDARELARNLHVSQLQNCSICHR